MILNIVQVSALVGFYVNELYQYVRLEYLHVNNMISISNFLSEPLSSWHKKVYENVIEPPTQKSNSNDDRISKSEAREILGLSLDADASTAKKAWRKKSFEYHPDRFVGKENTPEAKAAPELLMRVNLAYEAMSSGIRNNNSAGGGGVSWYESLGGKDRQHDFSGAMQRKFNNSRFSKSCNLYYNHLMLLF